VLDEIDELTRAALNSVTLSTLHKLIDEGPSGAPPPG
jgi:hypothetical protein